MTRRIFLFAMIFFMLASQAGAKVQTFENFSVDVPSGWTASMQGSSLVVKTADGNSSVVVSFNSMGDASLSDIVERLYIQMEGVDLEEDEDGDYSFSYKNLSGTESVALITGDDGYYLVVSMTGFEDEDLQGDFETILDSIDWND